MAYSEATEAMINAPSILAVELRFVVSHFRSKLDKLFIHSIIGFLKDLSSSSHVATQMVAKRTIIFKHHPLPQQGSSMF